ncbi:MAG: hypothetical protein AAF902_12900 [Chloroflexota bacterium]
MTDPNDANPENQISEQAIKNNSGELETFEAQAQRGVGRNVKGNQRKGRAGNDRSGKREPREFKLTSEGLQRHFLACQNCCYFFAGIQVIYGRDVNDRFLQNFDGRWFSAPLSKEVKQLLEKTFDLNLDDGSISIDFACPICCRRYVIENLRSGEDIKSTEAHKEIGSDRTEPVIFEEPRTREERLADWDSDGPKLMFEYKNRR